MSRFAPRPFSLALAGLTSTVAPSTPLARVQEVWPVAAGEAVAEAAQPTAERSGVLTVACSAAVWAQELTLMSSQLIERLNSALGEELVHELRCRTE
jgi:predicted nucleic acid-binding Zn ribbon protein